MNKHIMIINPCAGNTKLKKFIRALDCTTATEMVYTKKRGDAKELACFYSNTYPDSIIYSVGGDGTLNEVVNGINPKAKLCVVPTGSGNDFYRVYDRIEGTRSIDLGVVNERKFINIASLGIDAKIANTANKIKNNSRVKLLSYPRAIIEEIIKYKPLELDIDGCVSETTLLTVCNGKYYGSGIPINPDYDLSNGYFNVIEAEPLTRREIIILFLKIFKAAHLNSPKIYSDLKDKIVVESDQELICNVDGEIIRVKKFDFSVIKDGLTLTTDIPQYVKKAIKTIK